MGFVSVWFRLEWLRKAVPHGYEAHTDENPDVLIGQIAVMWDFPVSLGEQVVVAIRHLTTDAGSVGIESIVLCGLNGESGN